MAAGHRWIAGCDEVGRGALAGPVSVGMVVIDASATRGLRGVRDSKLLSAADRVALVPKIQRWALAYGVGHASAAEIDDVGLMAALKRAGDRAWSALHTHVRPDAVVLDGNYNWLAARAQASLFDGDGGSVGSGVGLNADYGCNAPVYTKIKADLQCLSVAAASVLAKVERDAHMVELALAYPGYSWELNKGYGTAAHREAIVHKGPAAVHRRSWNLTGMPRVPAEADVEGPVADLVSGPSTGV